MDEFYEAHNLDLILARHGMTVTRTATSNFTSRINGSHIQGVIKGIPDDWAARAVIEGLKQEKIGINRSYVTGTDGKLQVNVSLREEDAQKLENMGVTWPAEGKFRVLISNEDKIVAREETDGLIQNIRGILGAKDTDTGKNAVQGELRQRFIELRSELGRLQHTGDSSIQISHASIQSVVALALTDPLKPNSQIALANLTELGRAAGIQKGAGASIA